MKKQNCVYIGVSLDGYIADSNGNIEYLNTYKLPEGEDMGYYSFMDRMDALVMGRITFETVLGFGVPWPYKKPVYVLSNSLKDIPPEYEGKVFLKGGNLDDILAEIHQSGHHSLYIDGGSTIQGFLQEDLIEEMIITTIPVLIGGGHPLFGTLDNNLKFKCIETKLFDGKIVQSRFLRNR
ncbi:dihydrofolate reductase family protein [Roseivirga sp.]|uniref:dihydrofolate reductase family protein n=1 Tax=Roseivirga sp. TaxID=1964215 RepID=UPI003B8C8F31